jgi:hypothetical protein
MSLQGGRCFLSDRTELLAGPMDESESVQLYLGFSSIKAAQKAWDIATENGAKIKMEFGAQEWGRQIWNFGGSFWSNLVLKFLLVKESLISKALIFTGVYPHAYQNLIWNQLKKKKYAIWE